MARIDKLVSFVFSEEEVIIALMDFLESKGVADHFLSHLNNEIVSVETCEEGFALLVDGVAETEMI